MSGLLAVYSTRARYFESTSAGLFQTVAQLLHAVLASSRQQSRPSAGRGQRSGHRPRQPAACQTHTEEHWNLENREHATVACWPSLRWDGFRGVNDRFGRLVGNGLAQRATSCASECWANVRRTDMVIALGR